MKFRCPVLFSILFLILVPAISGQAAPKKYDMYKLAWVADFDNKGLGFDLNYYIGSISKDEYDFIISRAPDSITSKLVSKEFANGTAKLVYHAADLADIDSIRAALESLHVVYDKDQKQSNMLDLTSSFREYVFSKLSSARSSAQYTIKVQFDPVSEVDIGGFRMETDFQGEAVFEGQSLGLAEAKKGVIRLIDGFGNQVKVEKDENGQWFVMVSGVSGGKSKDKKIVVEALK